MRSIIIVFGALLCLAGSSHAMAAPSQSSIQPDLDRMCARISYRINTLVDHSNTGCRTGIDEGGRYSIVVFSLQAIVPEHKLREHWLDVAVDTVGLFARAEGLDYFSTVNILDRFDIDDGRAYQIPVETAASLQAGYSEGTLTYEQYHSGVVSGLTLVSTIQGK